MINAIQEAAYHNYLNVSYVLCSPRNCCWNVLCYISEYCLIFLADPGAAALCKGKTFNQDTFSSGYVPPREVGTLTVAVGISQNQGFTFSWGYGKWLSGFAGAGELDSGTPEMVGGGGPALECEDIKIVRWEPPGRQIQGQVMPLLPKQRKNEIKSVSHLASQVTLYSGKNSNLI